MVLLAVGLVLAGGQLLGGLGGVREATVLDPELAARVELARAAAASEGVELVVNSGLRSAAEQQRIFDEAVERYGSEEEAARWALPPERSAHVQGLAVDVGPPEGAAWLAERSADFGLCRVYANEPWHYEALVAPGGTCPALVEDAAAG